MGRHKRSRRSSSTSSSNSSSHSIVNKKKRYRRELRKSNQRIEALEGLVKNLRNNQDNQGDSSLENLGSLRTIVRYVGRNDFIPEFDPQSSTVPIEHWLRNLESISKIHGWDEPTLICNCTSKLRGYAKSWYERQPTYELSWSQWKEKLITSFPFTKNKLCQIRELVNRVKLPNENVIEFYYNKLGIGISCQLTDDVICQAIVGTLGNKLLEVGALSAGCHDTTSLLKYLASFMNTNDNNGNKPEEVNKPNINKSIKCFKCNQDGHKAFACSHFKNQKDYSNKCSFCNKSGHTESVCFKKKNQDKFCSYCKIKGHVLDECRKHSAATQHKSIRKVQQVNLHD